VRAVGSSAQPNQPFGEYAAKTLGYKRVATIGDDFAFGHETTAGFQRAFEDSGGKIVQKQWAPLNVADQTASVPPSGSDWVYEIKWDGMRALVRNGDGRIVIRSRHGVDFTSRFPELGLLAAAVPASTILDGEIVRGVTPPLPTPEPPWMRSVARSRSRNCLTVLGERRCRFFRRQANGSCFPFLIAAHRLESGAN